MAIRMLFLKFEGPLLQPLVLLGDSHQSGLQLCRAGDIPLHLQLQLSALLLPLLYAALLILQTDVAFIDLFQVLLNAQLVGADARLVVVLC